MQADIQLIFLNGPMPLEPIQLSCGPFSIGEGGDVWAEFDSKTPQITLKIEKNGVHFISDLPCWIDGNLRDLSEASRQAALPLHQSIDLDGVAFLLLPKGESLSDLPQAQRSLKPRQARRSSAAPISSSPSAWSSTFALGLEALKKLGWLSLVGAGGTWFLLHKIQERRLTLWAENQDRSKMALKEALLKDPYGHLQVTYPQPHEVEIQGRCRSSIDFQNLIQPLRAQGWVVKSRVFCDDALAKNVLYGLELLGFDDIKVEPGSRLGSVLIRGEIEGDARWQKAERLLMEMSGLERWEVFNDQAEPLQWLHERLAGAHLNNKLDVVQRKNRLLLTGKLDGEEEKIVQSILDEMQDQHPGLTGVHQNIKAAFENEEVWPAPIVSVGGTPQQPFVELQNGERLQIGSQLPSGYQIVRIDGEEGIRLMKKNKFINVPVEF